MPVRRSVVSSSAPPMSDTCAALLLRGYGAYPPTGRVPGFGDTFALFEEGDAAFVRAWRQHEDYLRALAKRWNWEPMYWVTPVNEFGLRQLVEAIDPDTPAEDVIDDGEEIGGPGWDGPHFYAQALHCCAGPQCV